MVHSKYKMNKRKNRDCTKCKKFGGLVGKNYFICRAEMYNDKPHCHDIYDRDILFKGSCNLFVPKEIDQDDHIHVDHALERCKQKDATVIPDQE